MKYEKEKEAVKTLFKAKLVQKAGTRKSSIPETMPI